MEGKPDGRRTRPEPLLLTQSGEPLSGTAYCEQNAFDSREAMSGSSGRAGQDEHMPQSPELRQDVIIRGPSPPGFRIKLYGIGGSADVCGIQHAVAGDALG
jgi:hypothetical protein